MTNTFLEYQVEQLCQNAIDTCPFTNPTAGADCTKKFCLGFPAYIGVATCVSLGLDPDNCCESSDPTDCLNNFAHGSGGGGGGSSGTGAANVCASVISILETCFTLNPSLSPSADVATSGPSATALASCACYDTDGTYDPDQFDNYASECQASGSAAHPTYFPIVTPLVGFCTNNAGASAPASAAAPSTTAPAATAATTSTPVGSSDANAGGSAPSNSGGQPSSGGQNTAVATTSANMGTTPSATSASPAQTTTSKSGGVKISLRKGAILLLGLSVLCSLY